MASGDAGARLGGFRVDRAGVRGIFTGAGMQAALGSLAFREAAKASAIASAHHVDHRPVGDGAYEAAGKVLANTAVAVVRPSGRVGALDQAIHHTLDQINH